MNEQMYDAVGFCAMQRGGDGAWGLRMTLTRRDAAVSAPGPHIIMTPESARALGNALLNYADVVERMADQGPGVN